MQQDLAADIRKTAARVRMRDFFWAAGISAAVAAALLVSGEVAWRLVLIAWLSFLAALGVRYRLSPGRAWARAVQHIAETELADRQAGLATLRMARDVAEALPEPLFILDANGVVELANPAAGVLVGSNPVEGRHFATVLRAPAVFEAASAVLQTGDAINVDFTTTGSVERSCRAFIAPLGSAGGDTPRSLVFIRDLTSERRVEQMRADFIASASHELRTPLSSVLGFIETLRGRAKGDPEAQEKFLKIMQSQAERMQRLVSDLMSLSRIELNEHVPPKERIDLAEIAQDVVASLSPLFERSEAIVDFTNEAGTPVMIIGDRDEIFQAVQNLLDNAVKYGGAPAMVKIKVGRGQAPLLPGEGETGHRAGDSAAQVAARQGVSAENLVYVQIRDFGPGIERADLPRLTERFYRVNVERSLKSGGTGLGLAIVKHIINRHKGGFQIESRLGGGSAFNCYFLGAP